MTSSNSRRTFLTRSITYAGLMASTNSVPVFAQERDGGGDAEPRPLPDMLDYMVKTLGPPRQAQVVSAEEAANYKDRVPPRLIRFWQEHGRGSYFDGMYWICDPAPFRAVLDFVFDGDPEFNSADMTAVAYTAFGRLKVWDRHRVNIGIEFTLSQVHCPPPSRHINSRTGERFPDDFMIGTMVGIVRNQFSPSEHAFLEAASKRLGPLAPGEVYGFFPALQLGGAYTTENLRRVKAAEHFSLLAQLAPMNSIELTPPEPPRFPYGRQGIVRQIGRTR